MEFNKKTPVIHKQNSLSCKMTTPIPGACNNFASIQRVDPENPIFLFKIPADGFCAIYTIFVMFHIMCIWCNSIISNEIEWNTRLLSREYVEFFSTMFHFLKNGDLQFPSNMDEAKMILYDYLDDESKETIDKINTENVAYTLEMEQCLLAFNQFLIKRLNSFNLPEYFAFNMSMMRNVDENGIAFLHEGGHFDILVSDIILQTSFDYLACHGKGPFHNLLESFLGYFYKTRTSSSFLVLNSKNCIERFPSRTNPVPDYEKLVSGHINEYFKVNSFPTKNVPRSSSSKSVSRSSSSKSISSSSVKSVSSSSVKSVPFSSVEENIRNYVIERSISVSKNIDSLKKIGEIIQTNMEHIQKLISELPEEQKVFDSSESEIEQAINNSIVSERIILESEISELEREHSELKDALTVLHYELENAIKILESL